MKKLPEIYKQPISKKITNNNTIYYATRNTKESSTKNKTNIEDFLNQLFHETGYVFNKPLLIETKDKIYDTAIIKRSDQYIYTLSEDKIKITEILSIKKK